MMISIKPVTGTLCLPRVLGVRSAAPRKTNVAAIVVVCNLICLGTPCSCLLTPSNPQSRQREVSQATRIDVISVAVREGMLTDTGIPKNGTMDEAVVSILKVVRLQEAK